MLPGRPPKAGLDESTGAPLVGEGGGRGGMEGGGGMGAICGPAGTEGAAGADGAGAEGGAMAEGEEAALEPPNLPAHGGALSDLLLAPGILAQGGAQDGLDEAEPPEGGYEGGLGGAWPDAEPDGGIGGAFAAGAVAAGAAGAP